MSRFDADLRRVRARVSMIQGILAEDLALDRLQTESSQLFGQDVKTVGQPTQPTRAESDPQVDSRQELLRETETLERLVYQIKENLTDGDPVLVVKTYLSLENRMRRFARVAELSAPTKILEHEVRWVDIMAQHMMEAASGMQPIFTPAESEDIEIVRMNEAGVLDESFDMQLDKIKGGLIGHAIGDAMGATTEFMTTKEIQESYGWVTGFVGGGWLNVRPGQTTDDTAMTICVGEGILKAPETPIEAIGERFLAWAATDPPDIGITIRSTFDNYNGNWFDAAHQTHGESGGMSAGNGSLMRCLPVAIAYPDGTKMEQITTLQSKMTHYDDLASEACVIYNRIASRLLQDEDLKEAIQAETENTRYEGVYLSKPDCQPDGFVVHTFTWVLYLLWNCCSYEDTIQEAINAGGDADTVAAIAGGLRGIVVGLSALPPSLVEQLEDKTQIEVLAESLNKLRSSSQQ